MKRNKTLKKVMVLFAVAMLIGCMAVPAFATSETGDTVDVAVSAIQSALSEATGTINIGNVLTIIGAAIGASILLVFFWWGLRKVIRAAMAAFRSGKLKV